MAEVNVTIIGLGRLGASFGLALKALKGKPEVRHRFHVTGCDRAGAAMRAALKVGAIDRDVPAMDVAVEGADLVFLAAPFGEVKDILEIIGQALKPGAVVMDTAPLKMPPIRWAEKYFRRGDDKQPDAYIVGVTPIINPEHLGDPTDTPEAAKADLLQNGMMIVSPSPSAPPEAVQLVTDLSELLNIRVHFIDPAEHDGIAAAMESLPLLIQLGLFQSLSQAKSWDDVKMLGNNAFFLATYRLAEERPETLAAHIFHNRENTLRRLDALLEALANLRESLRAEDEIVLAEQFDSAARSYAEWQFARLRNKYGNEPEAPQEVRGSFGLGSLFFPRFGGRDKTEQKKKK